jgi:outer membrane protein TolC
MKIAFVAVLLTIFTTHSYAQIPLPQNPFAQTSVSGSIQSGTVSPQPLPLSLADAIDRGLRYNLAVLAGTQEERAAAAGRLRALYDLYPKLNADILSTQQQINLAAFGFGGFPGIRQVVGPFALVDARARLTQSVFDRELIDDLKEAKENQKAASFNSTNTRELVVVAIANLYLQALAGTSRIEAVEAQLARAQTLLQRATDLKNSGLIAGIDVLRAQVELQNQQQRRLAFQNEFALQKLNLIRAIGIPLGQEIVLTDHMPTSTPSLANLDDALRMAAEQRADLKRSQSLVEAARHALNSAKAENLPKLEFAADYGTIGRTLTQNHGTYSMTGRLRIPLFNGTESRSDQQQAAARLESRRLEGEDLKGRVEMEVRAAYLDLQSSQEQLRVAQSSRDLSQAQLDQSQDRFEAGVAGNLEVVQAQESVALADENVIASLYTLNVAKARLARAMGSAEQMIKTFLGGRQ